jgi:hypothetical protein
MGSILLLLVAGKSKANAIRRKMSGEAVFGVRSAPAEHVNGVIIVSTLSFRHAVSRNPLNSNGSGCRITSGMTVFFRDDH